MVTWAVLAVSARVRWLGESDASGPPRVRFYPPVSAPLATVWATRAPCISRPGCQLVSGPGSQSAADPGCGEQGPENHAGQAPVLKRDEVQGVPCGPAVPAPPARPTAGPGGPPRPALPARGRGPDACPPRTRRRPTGRPGRRPPGAPAVPDDDEHAIPTPLVPGLPRIARGYGRAAREPNAAARPILRPAGSALGRTADVPPLARLVGLHARGVAVGVRLTAPGAPSPGFSRSPVRQRGICLITRLASRVCPGSQTGARVPGSAGSHGRAADLA